MAKAIWTGSVGFGLVNIPVGIYAAVDDRSISFHQLERGTDDRIRYKRVNERTGEEVEYENIVKGYETGNGHIVVTDNDLANLEAEKTKSIEIDGFCQMGDIPPITFDKTYYLAPRDTGVRAYGLFRDALRKTKKVGIGTFVMRGREHICALRADGNVIMLTTLHYADEVRQTADLNLPTDTPVKAELDIAVQLINAMGSADPKSYADGYRERVLALVEEKMAGKVIPVSKSKLATKPPSDLMEALKASVAAKREKAS